MLSSTNSFTSVGGNQSRLKVDSVMLVGSVSGVRSYPLSVNPRRVIKPYARMRNSSGSAPSSQAISSNSEELRTQRPSFSAPQSYREEELLAKLVRIHGTDWNLIARYFSPCGTRTPTELQALWNQYRQTSAITVQHARNFRRKNCPREPTTSLSSRWFSDVVTTGSENLCSIESDTHLVVQGNRSKSFAPSPVCPLKDLNLTSAAGSRHKYMPPHADSSVSVGKDFDVWLDITTTPSPKITNSNLSVKRSRQVHNHRPSSIRRLEVSLQKHYSPDHSPSLVSPACSPSPPHKTSPSPLPANLHFLEPSQISCISTPLKGAPFASDEHMFAVQTPTKAIGESDLQSFHLVSPPSVFPASASKSGNRPSNPCFPSASLKPRALFSPTVDAKPVHNKDDPSLFRVIKAEQDSEARVSALCSQCPKIKRSSSPMPLSSDPPSSQLSSPFLPPRRLLTPLFPGRCNSDSIALLTAKDTVWNRVQTAKEVNNTIASSASRRSTSGACKSALGSIVPRARQNSSPFAFSVQQEPQLSMRRILQVASEINWRRVAFGTSGTDTEITHLARLLLDHPQKRVRK